MLLILLLILLGILFLLAELLLLPGISVGGVLAVVCYGSAVWLAVDDYGSTAGWAVAGLALAAALATVVIALRAKTWQRLSLTQKLEAAGQPRPEELQIRVGDRGRSVSRLSPMGTVEIGGKRFEAKSADIYIDPRTEVEVVGFENANIIVKPVKQ